MTRTAAAAEQVVGGGQMSETTAAGGQAIMAIVSLVGAQDTAVAAHRPGTDGAAVSVRIGKTLVYLGDQETAVHFRRVWETGLGQARTIPVHADPTRIMPLAGVAEPSLMLDAAGSPPAAVRLERPAGRSSSLRVNLGRIAFDVRDRTALRSTVTAFQQAERLAARTFPRPTPGSAHEQAANTAARLFGRPHAAAAQPGRASPSPRVAAAARPAAARVERPAR